MKNAPPQLKLTLLAPLERHAVLHVPLPADVGCQRVVKCCLLIFVLTPRWIFCLIWGIRFEQPPPSRFAALEQRTMEISRCEVFGSCGNILVSSRGSGKLKGYGYGESAKSAAVPRLKKHGTSRPKIFKALNINEFSYSHFFSLHFVVVTRNGISGRARLAPAPLQSVVDADDLDIALTETRPPVSAGRFEAIRQEAKAIETKHNYVLIVHHHSQQFQQWTGWTCIKLMRNS